MWVIRPAGWIAIVCTVLCLVGVASWWVADAMLPMRFWRASDVSRVSNPDGVQWGQGYGVCTTWLFADLSASPAMLPVKPMPKCLQGLRTRAAAAVQEDAGHAVFVMGKGFPLPWLYEARVRDLTRHIDVSLGSASGTAEWPYDPPMLRPAHVGWPAFFVDAVAVSGLVLGLVAMAVRHHNRAWIQSAARQGVCAGCGYPQTSGIGCPECGHRAQCPC